MEWRRDRVADLKKNWLSIIGLFWLREGENSFGSDPKSDVVLPRGSTPARAGTFLRRRDEVVVRVSLGVRVTSGGLRVREQKLEHTKSDNPTVLEIGGLRLDLLKYQHRMAIEVKDVKSPSSREFSGAEFFPLSSRYRVQAAIIRSDPPKMLAFPDVLSGVAQFPAMEVRFKLDGREFSLFTRGDNPHRFFVIFADATNKTKETYPGGRYLEAMSPDGKAVELDFNRAESPPCAFTPYTTCTLAPKENRLPIRIEAGEKFSASGKRAGTE